MRVLKLGGALVVALALGMVTVAVASAEETLWLWLPGAAGTKFTEKSGKTTLQVKGGPSITCASDETLANEGELTESQTLLLRVRHLLKCTEAGLPVNSLGDAGGTILIHMEIHDCMIGPNDPGLLIKVLQVHLEVPSTKLLEEIEDEYITLILPRKEASKTFTLTTTEKEGKQSIEKCEGGTAHSLKASVDSGELAPAGFEELEDKMEFETIKEEAMG
jgi:hypothetical protein